MFSRSILHDIKHIRCPRVRAIRPHSPLRLVVIGVAVVSCSAPTPGTAQGPVPRRSPAGATAAEGRVTERPAYELSRSPFGLHVIPKDLAGPIDIGARWTRAMVLWKQAEPRKGHIFDLDRAVAGWNALSDAGFDVLPRIESENPWAHDERINRMNAEAAAQGAPMGDWTYFGMPTDVPAYRRFLTTIVERYDGDGTGDAPGLKKGVKYWQVENEWDWRWKDTPEQLVEFLKIAYQTIKAADPEATVVLGGLSKLAPDALHAGLLGESVQIDGKVVTPQTLERQKAFREEHPLRTHVLEHGYPYFDVISFHQYGRYPVIEKDVEYLRGIMRRRGYEKPLWMTEAGGPFTNAGETYTEDRQAQEVVKYYVTALASGVEVIFWSTYLPTPEWGPAFTNTALVDAARREKPAYHSYKVMTSQLRDATRVERLFGAERGQLVRFTRKGRGPVYVAWWDGAREGAGAAASDRIGSLLQKLEGRTLDVTWYDGTRQSLSDPRGDGDRLLRKGPAFIEVR